MYIRGLIPRKFAESAEVVPIALEGVKGVVAIFEPLFTDSAHFDGYFLPVSELSNAKFC